jgi:hypothetical protein
MVYWKSHLRSSMVLDQLLLERQQYASTAWQVGIQQVSKVTMPSCVQADFEVSKRSDGVAVMLLPCVPAGLYKLEMTSAV